MTIEEMRERKRELGYTNEMISELSGVPLGTVQKIFAGFTKAPRRGTVEALEKVLKPDYGTQNDAIAETIAGTGEKRRNIDYRTMPQKPIILKEPEAAYTVDPKQGSYTLEDYYAFPEERRVELIDGVIYDMAAPTDIHQTVLVRMSAQLIPCVDAHPDCQIFISPIDVRLDNDDYTMVQPDLIIVCGRKDRDHRRINGAPDFIVEILSPSNRYHDMFRKLNKYRNAGVREYWIVDPEKKRITVYDFENEELPESYTFRDMVPLRISDGQCSVDFVKIEEILDRYI